jgi:hypothetical protein
MIYFVDQLRAEFQDLSARLDDDFDRKEKDA